MTHPDEKPLFTISVAAEILSVHPRTIMIYEKAGFIAPFRTSTNRRRFSRNDLRTLFFIKHLTQERNINLAGIKTLLLLLVEAEKHKLNLKEVIFPKAKEDELLKEAFSR